MVSPTFLVEIRKFCQSTSVRGVPRIMNSKSTLQSVTWSVGVLTCACLLGWQMVVIFNRYLSFGFSTVLVRSPDWDNATFPDITICNLCPLVNDKEMNLSYTEYFLILKQQFVFEEFKNTYNSFNKINDSGSNLLNSIFIDTLQFLKSPAAYFLNFPILSHFGKIRSETPIVDCSYFHWDYYTPVNYNCVANIEQHWVPDFYKCYTLRLDDIHRKSVLGFSAVIYVEDFLEALHGSYVLGLSNTQSTGMQVLLHQPGAAADMKLGIPIGTGTSTTITIEQTKITHLPHPYSNCTTQKTIGDLDPFTTYTKEYCLDVCLQKQYIERCRCTQRSLQFTYDQLKETNSTICGNLSLNELNSSLNWDGVYQMLCAHSFNPDQTACEQECFTPCDEYQYKLSASAAPWPHKSAQISFYYQYLQPTSRFGNEFHLYENIVNSSNISVYNYLLQKADQDGVIKNCFLQLNVQFGGPSFLEQKDLADFSFDAFGAQVGGVLSLWLGVTIIFIFELCEVIINLVAAYFRNKPNEQSSSKEISVTKL